MSSKSDQVHDATTGFHDIKPIAEFHPIPLSLVIVGLIVLLVVAIFLLRKRKEGTSLAPLTTQTPEQIALNKLTELEVCRKQAELSIREFALRLSLILRSYLTLVLLFSAEDQTAKEVLGHFLPALQRLLPNTHTNSARQFLPKLSESLTQLLNSCEKMSFADTADITYSLASIESIALVNTAIEFIQTITQLSKEEHEEAERQLRLKVAPHTHSPTEEA